MKIQTIGIDLAKNVFQVHGVDEQGEVIVVRQLRRKQVIPFLTKIEPCLIGMEACATAHHWGRELTKLGHTVRLIPPVYVKAYVKRSKNDAADAAAICEAVTRPSMRFVPIKTEDQQAAMAVHRARSLLIRQRTQLTAGTSGRVGDHCRDGSRRSGSTRRNRHGCAFDRISASRDGAGTCRNHRSNHVTRTADPRTGSLHKGTASSQRRQPTA